MELRKCLFDNQDLKYKDFNKKLIPNVCEDEIIGVRLPVLRKIAKTALKESAQNECYYFEEKMIYGFCIADKKCSVSEHIKDLKIFVPMIDNWSVCDSCCSSFKFVNDNKSEYYDYIKSCINGEEFSTRFAVVMLMDYYLTDEYIDDVIDILINISSDYYVKMAVAWAISVAFIKYQDRVEEIFKSKSLDKITNNYAIQKICDSFRVDKQTKTHIKKYKRN